MEKALQSIRKQLILMGEEGYKVFTQKLMPTVPNESVIGVRTPALRKYAKSLSNQESSAFLSELPHKYYEENNLHAFLIEQITDYDSCIAELNKFLPYVDNWATCDSMRPKVLAKNKGRLILDISKWLESPNTYAVRFGIEMLMCYFLDSDFKPLYMQWVANVKSDEYYIKMMQAWYFATALVKQYTEAVKYFQNPVLDKWTHNKAISKACESFRITPQVKEYLKTKRQ